MRPVTQSLLAGIVALGMVLCMQGCGKDSRLKWIEQRLESGGGSGAIDRIREQLLKSEAGSGGGRGPDLSVLNTHCHSNPFLGRGELPLFLTMPLLDLIDNFTQDELEDMTLVIEREMPVVENGSQKTKVKLNYLLPLQLYFMVQDVVGPDQMASEEVKKIFYMFGIPFLPQTYAELTSQSRVVSLKPEAYAQSWFNARRYFEHLPQWDLHQRVMNEILPQGDLVSWLETRGFLRDEIDYLLKLLWLKDAPPESMEHETVYVSFDHCSSTLEVPWFASLPGFEIVPADKKPDEIRDLYFELTLFFPIFITGYFCPSPTPSPTSSTPVHDWVYKPSPTPKYVDQVVIKMGDKVKKATGDIVTIGPGDKVTTSGGDTVIIRVGNTVTIGVGDTVTTSSGDRVTISAGDVVTTGGGDTVTLGDGTSTGTGGDNTGTGTGGGGTSTRTAGDQVTQATAVLTYGGCSCSTPLSFPAEGSHPAFKVCVQAPPNDKGWDGNSHEDTSSWLVYNQYNGAVTLSYNDTANKVDLLKCCNKQQYEYPDGKWNYHAIQITVDGGSINISSIHFPYTPSAQYQMCNDSDHVFAFPGGTGTPHGVLTDPNRAVSSLPAQTWYDFVTAHPINPTQCP